MYQYFTEKVITNVCDMSVGETIKKFVDSLRYIDGIEIKITYNEVTNLFDIKFKYIEDGITY